MNVVPADAATALPTLPAIVTGTLTHRRHRPVRHGFRYRHYLWLVDLDDLPRLPWYLRPLASFRSSDHLTGSGGRDPGAIKQDVLRFLKQHGVEHGGQVLMLANARVLGHVFDPLTVFWCRRPDGTVGCIVAEVHNTYGGRHAYFLEPDAQGQAAVAKEFYVSPFNDVSGEYRMRFTLSGSAVRVSVSLLRDGRRLFDAAFGGVPSPMTRTGLLRAAVRAPLVTYRVSALIRLHGIYLWLRRLPVVPRPEHPSQEALS